MLDDAELEEIRTVAERHRMTVSSWVRQALRDARRREPTRPAEAKLAALEQASCHGFPTADIDEMLSQIARGRDGSDE